MVKSCIFLTSTAMALIAFSSQSFAASHSGAQQSSAHQKQNHKKKQMKHATMKKAEHGASAFELKSYGHFKKMMHMKKTGGVVDINKEVLGPNVFAVGAPAHGTGEITIVDGKLWLDYGRDGLGDAKNIAKDGEQAVILVKAKVKKWRSIIVPKDLDEAGLHKFILHQAGAQGLAKSTPFPFLLEGSYFSLDWHILNGLKANGGGHGQGGLYKKIKQTRADAQGVVVGFYSAAMQGIYTHPGESWHLHVVFEEEAKAGHVDAISVRKGTVLKLPLH